MSSFARKTAIKNGSQIAVKSKFLLYLLNEVNKMHIITALK